MEVWQVERKSAHNAIQHEAGLSDKRGFLSHNTAAHALVRKAANYAIARQDPISPASVEASGQRMPRLNSQAAGVVTKASHQMCCGVEKPSCRSQQMSGYFILKASFVTIP
jgi:hypothetical protein